MVTTQYIAEHIDGWHSEREEPRTTEQLIAAMAAQSGRDVRTIRLRAHKVAARIGDYDD